MRAAIDSTIDATLRLDGFKKILAESEKAFANAVVEKMLAMGLVCAAEGRDKAVRTEWQVSVAPLGSIVIVGRQNRSESVFRLRVVCFRSPSRLNGGCRKTESVRIRLPVASRLSFFLQRRYGAHGALPETRDARCDSRQAR